HLAIRRVPRRSRCGARGFRQQTQYRRGITMRTKRQQLANGAGRIRYGIAAWLLGLPLPIIILALLYGGCRPSCQRTIQATKRPPFPAAIRSAFGLVVTGRGAHPARPSAAAAVAQRRRRRERRAGPFEPRR